LARSVIDRKSHLAFLLPSRGRVKDHYYIVLTVSTIPADKIEAKVAGTYTGNFTFFSHSRGLSGL